MASVSTKSNGSQRILFGSGKDRRCLYLGKMSERNARTICGYVESLLAFKETNIMDPAAGAWVASLGDDFHQKLADLDLVPSRKRGQFTLSDLIREFEASKSVKASTVAAYKQGTKALLDSFKPDRLLSTITPLDAEKWRKELGSASLAQATISKRTQVAKQLFGRAVKWGMIAANPFAEVRAGSQTNASRGFFVARDVITRVLDKAPDVEWRTIIALCRYAGLRCPTEVLALKWADVHFDRSRLVVTCEKTSHHAGKEQREVPILPELLPILLEAHECAPPKSEFVVIRYRSDNANLRTQFGKILKRAGVSAWPRLFHNLRASFETELVAEGHPIQSVAHWCGHSPQVATRHYLQVRDQDFAKASGRVVYEHDARREHSATQHQVAQTSATSQKPTQTHAIDAVTPKTTTPCTSVQGVSSGRYWARTSDLMRVMHAR